MPDTPLPPEPRPPGLAGHPDRVCRAPRRPGPDTALAWASAWVLGVAALSAQSALAAPAAQAAEGDAADQAFYRRAATCAAVMKPEVVRLAERWRSGERAVRGDIQRLTELSFTFVGVAYKRGLRGEAADRLLAEAERAQAAQPASALRQLSADCQAEARQLLDRSNVIERLLVRNRAKARVEHLLDDTPAAPGTPPGTQRAGA